MKPVIHVIKESTSFGDKVLYLDVVKVARTGVWYRDIVYFITKPIARIKHLFVTEEKQIDIKWRFEGDYGFRSGPSIFAAKPWFRSTEYGGWVKTGSRTTEDFRQEDWFRVGPPDALRVGGDGEGGYVPWNRLAHLKTWSYRLADGTESL